MTDWLTEAEARHHIEKVLRLYVRGVDRADPDIVRQAFHEGAELSYGAISGVTVDGFIEANIAEGWRDVNVRTSSSHFITNVTIDLDESGELAWTESYFVSVSRRRYEQLEDWIFGGRYLDRFERREGEWRIARRLVVEDWSRIDPVGRDWGARTSGVRGRRGPESHLDPVWTRL